MTPERPLRTGNLKVVLTRFFGRERDLESLHQMYAEGARLVTLVGTGGTGKTRLAKHFAALHGAESAPGGVWFCDLTGARDRGGVMAAIARSTDVALIGGAESHERELGTLAGELGKRGSVLIILDNCEQVVADAAIIAKVLLTEGPELRLMATSRETLRIEGERAWPVGPLSLEGADASDAVRLFFDRARSIAPRVDFTAEDSRCVAELVRRLDGLPLAIELAAARIALLRPPAMLAALSNMLDVLTAGSRDASDRHRSLRATIDWSWRLLQPREQAALAACSVFRGGFTIEAASQVIGATAAPGALSIDVLQSLLDKSLLIRDERMVTGQTRLAMYESIREYASEQLLSAGSKSDTERRHGAYYITLGDSWAAHGIRAGVCSVSQLEAEFENFVAAHRRALARVPDDPTAANDALRTLDILAEELLNRGPLGELVALLDAALSDDVVRRAHPRWAAKVFARRAYVENNLRRRADMGIHDGESALALAVKAGDATIQMEARRRLADSYSLAGDFAKARAHYDATLRHARQDGDRSMEARILAGIGRVEFQAGRLEESRSALSRAVEMHSNLNERLWSAVQLGNISSVYIELTRFVDARRAVNMALDLCREIGHRRVQAMLLGVRARLMHEEGEGTEAIAAYQEALTMLESVGDPHHATIFAAALAGLLALGGESTKAAALFARIDEAVKTDPSLRPAVDVHHGFIDVALSQSRAAAGQATESLHHFLAAQGRLESARRVTNPDDDLRFAIRMLALALDALAGGPKEAPRPKLPTSPLDAQDFDCLIVAEDGTWSRPPGGKRLDLSRRRNSRLLLLALVAHRIDTPGVVVAVDILIHSAWPNERIDPLAANSRIRVAISELRKLGLRGVLLRGEGGYLLDPSVRIVVAREASPSGAARR